MEEAGHVIQILESAQRSLSNADSAQLKNLSNQTVHSASTIQDAGSITLAVIVYALSKIVERRDYDKVSNWPRFVKKFNELLRFAAKALKEGKYDNYDHYLHEARKALSIISVNLKPYIQEVIRKASINKASRIYEHGISMGHTAQLLGITQWELADYAGQKMITEPYGESIDIKKRASMALEFFK